MKPELRILHLNAPQTSLHVNPVDYRAFILLKPALYKWHPKTLDGFWKIVVEERNKINFIF